MQRGIRDDSVVGILIHRRLAHIEDVWVGGPGSHVANIGASVLGLCADVALQCHRALSSASIEGFVVATVNGCGNQHNVQKVAHVILLAVVGIREDALRGTLEIALDAKRMTGTRGVGTRSQSRVAVEAVGHIARLDRYVHPAIGMLHTGGQQLAGLADRTRSLTTLATARLTRLDNASGDPGAAYRTDGVEQKLQYHY